MSVVWCRLFPSFPRGQALRGNDVSHGKQKGPTEDDASGTLVNCSRFVSESRLVDETTLPIRAELMSVSAWVELL